MRGRISKWMSVWGYNIIRSSWWRHSCINQSLQFRLFQLWCSHTAFACHPCYYIFFWGGCWFLLIIKQAYFTLLFRLSFILKTQHTIHTSWNTHRGCHTCCFCSGAWLPGGFAQAVLRDTVVGTIFTYPLPHCLTFTKHKCGIFL